MITDKHSLKEYLRQDLERADYNGGIASYLFNDIWRYLRILRRYEYNLNCQNGVYGKFVRIFWKLRLKKLGAKLGFDIPPNVFGPGLSLPHIGTIVVNDRARIGKNCRIHVCVNIGAGRYDSQCPVIGDNCYIGPGAKLFGHITLGNDISIGANAVVNKSFEEDGVTLVGMPARALARKD